MEHSKSVSSKLLPANAYRKLNPGEVYEPVVGAADLRPEVTMWSIGVGVAMVVVFTAAASYMALRAGNAIEASIPIAILAIFFGKLRVPSSTILENVMVQSVGQAAGVVAAGAAWQKYPELLAANSDLIDEVSGVRTPRALFLLAAGRHGLESGRAVLPEALVPAYLRMKVAEPPSVAG